VLPRMPAAAAAQLPHTAAAERRHPCPCP
jgi:hypothetical protein